MKRWIILLALGVPYVVMQDTYSTGNYYIYDKMGMVQPCGQDPEYCEDQAHALNDSHEWRMQKFELEDSSPAPVQEEPKVTDPYKY